jgi:iron complex transport system substrate-binding protein
LLLLAIVTISSGCDDGSPTASARSATTAPATQSSKTTVASLSPAATEILIGLGVADRLVAVSNYDADRDETASLPRVGDYQTTDWERLAAVRPRVMVTQSAADRLPPGMVAKAAGLNIQLVNVPITRAADIAAAMRTLGRVAGDPQAGAAAADQFEQRMAALRERTKSGRRVRTLIVIDDAGRGVAGRDNYLNDALESAGGENVIRGPQPYPTIDREILIDLDPEVIFQLLPDASPQVRAAAQQLWTSMPNLRAVRDGRVHIFTDAWVLRPSHHVAELAQRFAAALNEARPATTGTTTVPVPSTSVTP